MEYVGTQKDRYLLYLELANDGQGKDITTNGKRYLRTFDQWLDNQEGDPVEQDKHHAKQ